MNEMTTLSTVAENGTVVNAYCSCDAASIRPAKRFFGLVLTMIALAAPFVCPLSGQTQPSSSLAEMHAHSTLTIVVGFVGGFVHSDDLRHSEVHLIQQLRTTYGSRVRAEIFDNRHIKEAHSFILSALDTDNDGHLSGEERQQARIVLFGHSWGASAAVYLARDLQRDGIPVSLTVQVDSIRKHGEDDSVIPPNVHEAVNFYQAEGILRGRAEIRALDPSRTTILGNYGFRYPTEPAECSRYPWHDRFFFKGHTAIECDPRVWSEVNALTQMQLPPTETKVAQLPQALQHEQRTDVRRPSRVCREGAGASQPLSILPAGVSIFCHCRYSDSPVALHCLNGPFPQWITERWNGTLNALFVSGRGQMQHSPIV